MIQDYYCFGLHPITQNLLWHFGVATDRAPSREIFGTECGGGITLGTGRGGGLRGTGFRGAGQIPTITLTDSGLSCGLRITGCESLAPLTDCGHLNCLSGGLRITGRGGQIPTFTGTDCGLPGLISKGTGFFSGCSGCSTFTIDCFVDASFADGRGGSWGCCGRSRGRTRGGSAGGGSEGGGSGGGTYCGTSSGEKFGGG